MHIYIFFSFFKNYVDKIDTDMVSKNHISFFSSKSVDYIAFMSEMQ